MGSGMRGSVQGFGAGAPLAFPVRSRERAGYLLRGRLGELVGSVAVGLGPDLVTDRGAGFAAVLIEVGITATEGDGPVEVGDGPGEVAAGRRGGARGGPGPRRRRG